MINFDEEIKKYTPMKDVDEVAQVILREGTNDITDLVRQMAAELKTEERSEEAQ
ncbi:MAG: hypothetical protein IJ744_11745 [Lachnospiraceae bacterium]|nr:hypothetical protein [Lachnospiraceae bacterium]